MVLEGTVVNGSVVINVGTRLPEGAQVEVTVTVPAAPVKRISMIEFLKTLPPGPLVFKTPAEVDAYLLGQEHAADALSAQHSQLFPDTVAVRQRLQARQGKGPTDDAPLAHG